jgi:hypothetical protein
MIWLPEQPLPLRDVHVPPPPPWWPPAPGWWILTAVILLIICTSLLFWRTRHRRHVWRNRVLQEMDALAAAHDDDAIFASSLHQFLRRVAWRFEHKALQQTGHDWRQTLARVPLDDAAIDALMTLEPRMYRPHTEFDRQRVQHAARRWVAMALKGVVKKKRAFPDA